MKQTTPIFFAREFPGTLYARKILSAAFAFAMLGLGPNQVNAQVNAQETQDPLVSKSLSVVVGSGPRLFAFADDGTGFSIIDPFRDPEAIKTVVWNSPGLVLQGIAYGDGVLLRTVAYRSDSTIHFGLSQIDATGKVKSDSLIFSKPDKKRAAIHDGAAPSAMARLGDTLVLAAGKLGFAILKLDATGNKILAENSAVFRAVIAGSDSLAPSATCTFGKKCPVDTLSGISKRFGDPDSIYDIAVLAENDSGKKALLIASQTGLRRGILGADSVKKISLPGIADTARIAVRRIVLSENGKKVFVFTLASMFFSEDGGRNFQKIPEIVGLQTKPQDLTGFGQSPEGVWAGDSAFLNLNLARPGLVITKSDSLQRNGGSGSPADVLLESEDSLDIVRGQGRLTQLAIMRKAGQTVVAVGSTSRGLFYRRLIGKGTAFKNLLLQKVISKNLGEVITYPTLFAGVAVNGEPEYVNVGYRLAKDAKVTISVFNYAMEKVVDLVKNQSRRGGIARSENQLEDRWDGRDQQGRRVSVGTYYIRVSTDAGDNAFGKCLVIRGKK